VDTNPTGPPVVGGQSHPAVFVINLDRDVERLAGITGNLNVLGVPFARWPATDGATLDYAEAETDGVLIRDFGPHATAEAACGVSHIRLWRHVVEHNIPWALVLEDDARLAAPLPDRIAHWELPADADLVLLNARAAAGPVRRRGQRLSYADVIGGAGTEGYLVSLRGAQLLLAVTRPLANPLDFQMYAHIATVRAHDRYPFFWSLPRNRAARDVEVVAYRVVPPLVGHSDVGSSIGNGRHPRARFYCRALLDLNFDTDQPYGYGYLYPAASGAPADPTTPAPVTFARGVDFSHCPQRLAVRTAAALADRGVDTVRLSVMVDDRSVMNLPRAIRLARTAAGAGLQVYLALHYSDTWADPGRQCKPEAWRHLGIAELIDRLHTYTKDVVATFCRHDVAPAIVQLGNEVTNGLLWADDGCDERSGGRLHPIGNAADGPVERWDRDDQAVIVAEMLRCAAAGARDAMPAGQPMSTLIHLDRGADIDGARWWLDQVVAHDVDIGLLGLSFYSMWHAGATMDSLSRIGELHRAYPSTRVVISETAHPWRPYRDGGREYRDGTGFPFTPDGQYSYLESALSTIRHAPNGAGLFWWGACFIDSTTEPCPDVFQAHALLDADGIPLPALQAFGAVG
jgi:arabinogalactan endo-1,4-beta-galactosidase